MKENKIQLVVFDIAGTTVKDGGNIADSFLDALSKSGYQVAREEVNLVMGYKKPFAISLLLDKYYPGEIEKDPELVHKIHSGFTETMIDFYLHDPSIEPMEAAVPAFELLRSKKVLIALNTGFSKIITDAILNRLGWAGKGLVDFVISSDEVEHGRPSPQMIHSIMRSAGIASALHVAKVGDTAVDMMEGKTAGCGLVIGVTTGAYTRAQLLAYDPDAVIDSLLELPMILNLGPDAE